MRAIAPLVLAASTAAPAFSQPYDDRALLLQIGHVAGQAVACRFDDAKTATEVALRSADAMGYGDAETQRAAEDAAAQSAAQGCVTPDRRRAAEFWATVKRRVGTD